MDWRTEKRKEAPPRKERAGSQRRYDLRNQKEFPMRGAGLGRCRSSQVPLAAP